MINQRENQLKEKFIDKMKKIVAVIGLSLVTFHANANSIGSEARIIIVNYLYDYPSTEHQFKSEDFCDSLGRLAGNARASALKGVPKETIVKDVTMHTETTPGLRKLLVTVAEFGVDASHLDRYALADKVRDTCVSEKWIK